MNLNEILKGWDLNPAASAEAIRNAASLCQIPLPADYVEFLLQHNGGEGFIKDNYLILWKIEELSQFNQEYETEKYAPGIFLFGSNGGGEGFGFDTRTPSLSVVQIPFIGMEPKYARPAGNSFTELINKMNE